MTLLEQEQLKREVELRSLVLWLPEFGGVAERVTTVKHSNEEDGMVAWFTSGKYAALDNCELDDFIVGRRL